MFVELEVELSAPLPLLESRTLVPGNRFRLVVAAAVEASARLPASAAQIAARQTARERAQL